MTAKKIGWTNTTIGEDLAEEFGLEGDPPFDPDPPKTAKKKTTKKAKKKAKKGSPSVDPEKVDAMQARLDEFVVDDSAGEEGPEETRFEKLGLDITSECPVCRSLEPCECEEEDRAFQRRVRFEEDVKKVARCARCGAPLSVLYLPRPGATEPYRLTGFVALWVCSCCHPESLASAVLRVRG